MRNTIILSAVLLLAVIAMSVKYFAEISYTNHNLEKALKHIPDDAALILNFNNDESFYEIFSEYELFDAIIGQEHAAEINQLQQVLLKQPQLTEATAGRSIFISFHPTKADSVDFLYSINLSSDFKFKDADKLISQIPDVKVQKTQTAGLYKLDLTGLKKSFYLFVENGAAVGSFSEKLLLNSLDGTKPKLSKDFIEEINHTSSHNQNSPVNLFINHDKVAAFVSRFLRGKATGNSALLTKMKGSSSLNMNFKSDALMFNGISKPDTTELNYLNLFLNQKPVRNEIKTKIPENAANFIAFGISNYLQFKTNLNKLLTKRNELQQLQNQFALVKEKTGIDIDKDLKPFWFNEFAVVENSNREKFAIIKISNARKVNFSLQLISKQWDNQISQLNHSHLLYYFFGDPLKTFARPFYAITDNYLIVANTPGVLSNYLNLYEIEKFLLKTKEFAEYNQLVANQSNILYFIHKKNSEKVIHTAFKPNYASAFTSKAYGLKNFYGFSYQWAADDDHFFTNIYINYKSTGTKNLQLAWSVPLKAKLLCTPQLFRYSETSMLLVQDKSYNLYAINANGKQIWATQLSGKIQGQIHQLNDGSYLLNTQNKLYRFDQKGNMVNGFPVNLPFYATHGLSLSSTVSKPKIFIPAGNVIMAFDAAGKSLPDWNKSVNGKILFDIKLASVNKTDYVIAATQGGVFYFFDQNGNSISTITDEVKTVYKNPVYLAINSSENDTKLITADTSGSVVSITFNGAISRNKVFEPHGDFYFDYKNIAGNESPEFIFSDRNTINTFKADGSPLYIYSFDKSNDNKPIVFAINKYKFQQGASNSTHQLLLNEDGNLITGFPVKGSGYFLITDMKGNGVQYLISEDKYHKLSAYKL